MIRAIFIAKNSKEFVKYEGEEIQSGESVPNEPMSGMPVQADNKASGSGVKRKGDCQENLDVVVLDRASCVQILRDKQSQATDDHVKAFYEYISGKCGVCKGDDVFVFCHWGQGGSRAGVNALDCRLTRRLMAFARGKPYGKWKICAISSQRPDIFAVEENNKIAQYGIKTLPSTVDAVTDLANKLQEEREKSYSCTYDECKAVAQSVVKESAFRNKQVLIIPVTEDLNDLAHNVKQVLKEFGKVCLTDLKTIDNKTCFYPFFVDFEYEDSGNERARYMDGSGLMVPDEFVLRLIKDGKKPDAEQTVDLVQSIESRLNAWEYDTRLKDGLKISDLQDWMAGAFRRFCMLDEDVHGTAGTIDVKKLKADPGGVWCKYKEQLRERCNSKSVLKQLMNAVFKVEMEALSSLFSEDNNLSDDECGSKFIKEVLYEPKGSQIAYFSPVVKVSGILVDDDTGNAKQEIENATNKIVAIEPIFVSATDPGQTVIQQAISGFEAIKDAHKSYDFALLDLRLADAAGNDPSGYYLISLIKQFFPNLPIIIYSRYDDMGHMSRAFKMGADWFIRKDEIEKLPRHLLSILSIRNWRKEWDAIKRLKLCNVPEVVCKNLKKKEDFEKTYTEERKYLTCKCLEKLPGKNIEVTPTGGGFSSSATFRARKWSEDKQDKSEADKKGARVYLQDPVIIKIGTAFNTMTEYERYFRFIRPYIANESGRVEAKEITLDHNNSAITYTFAGKNDSSRVLDTMKNMLAEDVRYMARCDYKKYEAVFDEIFDDILPKIHRVSPKEPNLESPISSYPNRIFGETETAGIGFIDNYLARIPLSRQFNVKKFVDPGTSGSVQFEMHGVSSKGGKKVIEAYALDPYSKLNVILTGDAVNHVARYRELRQGQTLWVERDLTKETKTTELLDDIILQAIHGILDPNGKGQPKCFDGKEDYKFDNNDRNQEAKNCFISMCRNLGGVDNSIAFDKNDKHEGIVKQLYDDAVKLVKEDVAKDDDKKKFRCKLGIVHGDLNYANIMVDSKKGGTINDAKDVWLIDFARTRRDIIAHDFNVIFTATFSQLFNNDLWNDEGVGGDERYAARITRIFKTFIHDAMFAETDEVPDYIATDRRFTMFYKIFRRIRKAALSNGNMTEDMYALTTALCCLYTFKVFLKYEKNIQGAAALLATAYICIKQLQGA